MADRRRLFWVVFLGAAAALAVIPEFFESPGDDAVQPLARPRAPVPARAVPAAPATQNGQLAELRSVPTALAAATTAPAGTPPASAQDGTTTTAASGAAAAAPADAPPRAAPELFAAHSWY
ncbi:secretion system X translation initiation factor, partial [Aromatoleum evansii]|nr:secretion system X translation initiation factor [Aromatoleum evansii]